MTFDNTFSTPISVVKFMYDKEKEINDLLTESPFNSKGMWVRGSEYQLTDLVQDGNALYICIKEIQNSITKPSEDTEHFSVFFSGIGGIIKSVSYDNTNLHEHENEILSHVNGDALQSIHFKPSVNVTMTRNKLTINASGSSFSSDSNTMLFSSQDYAFIPTLSGTGSINFIGNIANCFALLSYIKTLGTWDLKLYTFSISDTGLFVSCTEDITNLNLEHLTINYKE